MKFYKLKNTEILKARHTDPLECVGADGVSSFYISKSDEELKDPFVEIQETDLPAEIRERREGEEEKITKEKIEKIELKEQEVQAKLLNFSSNALGKMGGV